YLDAYGSGVPLHPLDRKRRVGPGELGVGDGRGGSGVNGAEDIEWVCDDLAFTSGLHGDCRTTATLAARHCVNAARGPLTLAGLHALDLDEIVHGFAEKNGTQNMLSLSGNLAKLAVKHRTVDYEQFDILGIKHFHTILKSLAGVKPVNVAWSLAGRHGVWHWH